jgi:hypothetical protein
VNGRRCKVAQPSAKTGHPIVVVRSDVGHPPTLGTQVTLIRRALRGKMLLFYHSQQQPENVPFYKGKLFEELFKTFLGRLGYDVTLREKHNSLEYDIHGTSRLTGDSIIGEAKAHAKTISGHDFSSFVGKLLSLRIKNPGLVGLYLSTSALSAEAADYLRELEGTPYEPEVMTGDSLLIKIAKELSLPNPESVSALISSFGVFPLSLHYLKTDQGTFLVQISAEPAV